MNNVSITVNGVTTHLQDRTDIEAEVERIMDRQFKEVFENYLLMRLNLTLRDFENHLREVFPEKQV